MGESMKLKIDEIGRRVDFSKELMSARCTRLGISTPSNSSFGTISNKFDSVIDLVEEAQVIADELSIILT